MEAFDFHGKTRQDVFDYVVRFLAQQGRKSSVPDLQAAFPRVKGLLASGDGCVYRNPKNGDRCAFGAILPDAFYKSSMEGGPVDRVYFFLQDTPRKTKAYRAWLDELGAVFLAQLQKAHDNGYRNAETREWHHVWVPGGVARNYEELAGIYNLDTAALKEAFPDDHGT